MSISRFLLCSLLVSIALFACGKGESNIPHVVASPSWQKILDSTVNDLVIDTTNHKIVCASGGGVLFKSSDGGVTWSELQTGLKLWAIKPSNSQIIYAAPSNSWGVLMSSDGGASWSLIGAGWVLVRALVIDPNNDNVIYTMGLSPAGPSDCVFKSTNGGASWSQIADAKYSFSANPLTPESIYKFTIDAAGNVYASTGSNTFKYNNSTGSWTTVSNEIVMPMAIDPTNAQIQYAFAPASGVVKSTNGGVTWSAINRGLSSTNTLSLIIDPSNSDTLYAGTSTGVFRSIDEGGSWNAIGGLVINVFSLAIDRVTPQYLYASTSAGLYRVHLPVQ